MLGGYAKAIFLSVAEYNKKAQFVKKK